MLTPFPRVKNIPLPHEIRHMKMLCKLKYNINISILDFNGGRNDCLKEVLTSWKDRHAIL